MAIVQKAQSPGLLASEVQLWPVAVKMICNDFRRELDLPLLVRQLTSEEQKCRQLVHGEIRCKKTSDTAMLTQWSVHGEIHCNKTSDTPMFTHRTACHMHQEANVAIVNKVTLQSSLLLHSKSGLLFFRE